MYEVNLLPSRLQANFGWKVFIISIIFIIIILLIGLYCGFMYQYHVLKNKDEDLKMMLRERTIDLENINKLNKYKTDAEVVVENLGSMVNNKQKWSKLLLDISLIQTSNLQFNELEMYQVVDGENQETINSSDKGREQVKPVIYKVNINGMADSTSFVVNLYKLLKQKSYLQEVKLVSIKLNNNRKGYVFLITVVLSKEN